MSIVHSHMFERFFFGGGGALAKFLQNIYFFVQRQFFFSSIEILPNRSEVWILPIDALSLAANYFKFFSLKQYLLLLKKTVGELDDTHYALYQRFGNFQTRGYRRKPELKEFLISWGNKKTSYFSVITEIYTSSRPTEKIRLKNI